MYKKLYEAWKRERGSLDIHVLPSDFYIKLAEYMKKMREESRMLDKKTLRARLMERESKNAKKLVKKLFRLRNKKFLDQAKSGKSVPKNRLTREEEQLYEGISPFAESYQTLFRDVSRGRSPRVKPEKKKKMVVVRFLQEVPAIVGADMKTYGPFKAEDIAALPVENAKALIKQEAAIEVETRS